MSRLLLNTVAMVGLAALGAACSGDDGGVTHVDAAPERVALCTATLTLGGSFTPSRTVDPAAGCQPVGAWAVQVTVSDMGDCTAVHSGTSYSYTATDMVDSNGVPIPRTTSVTHNSPASGEDDTLTITGDNGSCTGNFDMIVPDGAMFDEIQIQPTTPPFASGPADKSARTLSGTGTYQLWATHP